MLSYRGYGKSEGSPSEKGLRIDAQVSEPKDKAARYLGHELAPSLLSRLISFLCVLG